jgi:predicted TPR repeat methyltransferase
LNLATVECSAAEGDQARDALERVLALDPDNDEARSMKMKIVDRSLPCRGQ